MATPKRRPSRDAQSSGGASVAPLVAVPPSPTRVRPPSRPCSGAVHTPLSPTKPLMSVSIAGDKTLLYTQPSSVHFSGFTLDQSYSQRVFVHNNSAKPLRLQYTLPSQPFFRASFPVDRKPFISPGLYEELLITFKPSAFQYYYDCVQIKCEQVAYASNTNAALTGKCLLPLHAYPVVNQVAFPTRMDFGAVPLGTTARKHFDLSCSVPIEFEYELLVVKPHPSFTIFPLSGSIPANGSSRIEFEFKPLLYATASAEIELRVSQLDFKPMRCVLAGSSASDTAVEVSSGAGEVSSPSGGSRQRPRTAERSGGSSASRAPLSSQTQTTNAGSPSRSTTKKRSSAVENEQKEPETVGGVQIPEDLTGMANVNFILTQQPGKLKPKDLKKAIDANRAIRQQQKEEQAKLSTRDVDDPAAESENDPGNEVVSPAVLSFHVLLKEESTAIQRAGVSRQIREMAFLQDLAEIDKIEKDLEFQSHKIRLGEELLTDEQLQLLNEMRKMNALELQRRERERLCKDIETKAFNMYTQPTPEMPYPPRGMLPAHFEPAITPDFKSYKNDLWARRKRVVQRLVRAISTVILRNRAQKRLVKLKNWLGNAKTRAQLKEKVARDWQNHHAEPSHSAGSLKHSTNTKAGAKQPSEGPVLYLESFPIVEEKEHRTREKIPQAPDDWDLQTDPFDFFQLQERDEALVMGHETPLELPPLPTYVPLENTRELRSGALDECAGPSLATTTSTHVLPVQDLRVPSTLEMLPRDVFLRRSAALRPLVRINGPKETDVTFVLRPQRVFRSTPRHWGLELDTGVGTRSLFSRRTQQLKIHERFTPRTERSRRVPPLLCIENDSRGGDVDAQLYRDVWDATDGFVPPLSQHADDVPCLSDSESDEEEEEKDEERDAGASSARRKRTRVPTWTDALQLWDGGEGAEATEVDEDGVTYEPGELYGKMQGVHSFARYRHLIQSERAYNAYRDEKLDQLPKLLEEVASRIDHPDYQLVVHGHGPSRSLHEPFETVFQRKYPQPTQ